MPVERISVSISQFCELVGIDPQRFVAIERASRTSTTVTIVLEPENVGADEQRDTPAQ
jgi:hypothetical protein